MFTGLFDLKSPGEYPYLTMEGGRKDEFHRGKPPAGRMRREISFEHLPDECREAVLRVYRELWDL